ncbi:hypothetical protein MKW94_030538 [Papaver nudicaule]|uniref:DUF7731 domain-containing protein n=1 Tax=Papaver nudicaule TaxID=74823 RepID=A0AA41VNF9_PAPNU|nr:hypothetical protein [Papaver nudicaule]
MAHSTNLFKPFFVIVIFLCFVNFTCCSSDYYDQYVGAQSQAIDRALVCFNNNFIFSSCAENNRLTETGLINVPPEQTEDYCNGPCLAETKLVLNCIDNMLSNFLFYNRATVRDIRSSLRTGCGFSNERGNFNVAQGLGYWNHASTRTSSFNHPMYLLMYLVTLGAVYL